MKPYYPVSLAAVTAPTGLSALSANRSVTLRWTEQRAALQCLSQHHSGQRLHQARFDLKWNYYTDNTAANGTTYYYVVTALDSLENESGYSSQAVGTPLSGANLGLVAEYKFEGGAQDSSGNGYNGILNGVDQLRARQSGRLGHQLYRR